jgi:hypothetical protein
MWLWSTLFDLGKTVFRGIGCLWFGAIGLVMTGGLALSFAMWAISTDPGGGAAVVSAIADENIGRSGAWDRDGDRRRAQRGSVAADWEQARRERDLEEAYRSRYDDEDY